MGSDTFDVDDDSGLCNNFLLTAANPIGDEVT